MFLKILDLRREVVSRCGGVENACKTGFLFETILIYKELDWLKMTNMIKTSARWTAPTLTVPPGNKMATWQYSTTRTPKPKNTFCDDNYLKPIQGYEKNGEHRWIVRPGEDWQPMKPLVFEDNQEGKLPKFLLTQYGKVYIMFV